MSSKARTKGHNFERWICGLLRGLGYTALTSRYESKRLDDLGSDIVTDFPYHIQAKAVESLTMAPHAMLSLMKEKLTDKPPVLWHKRNNKGIIVSMMLDDFIDMVNQSRELREKLHSGNTQESNNDVLHLSNNSHFDVWRI